MFLGRVYEVGLKNNNNKNVDCTNDINEIQHDDEFARRYLPQMTKERNKSLIGKKGTYYILESLYNLSIIIVSSAIKNKKIISSSKKGVQRVRSRELENILVILVRYLRLIKF